MKSVVYDQSVSWISERWNVKIEDAIAECSFLRVPFDYAVSFRPGARLGANSIINALNLCSLYCIDKKAAIDKIIFSDCGEVEIVHSFQESYHKIQEKILELPIKSIPIILGGDHSISDPAIRAMQCRNEEPFVIFVFDSHLDSRPPIKGKEHSGNWVKTLENTSINYKNFAQIGISANIYSHAYYLEAVEKGIFIATNYEIRKKGIHSFYEGLIERFQYIKNCYISLDIDVLDYAFANGTSVPNYNGLYPYELYDMLYNIALNFNVIGFDIVEISPPLDNKDNQTSHVAAQAILNLLAGISESFRYKV